MTERASRLRCLLVWLGATAAAAGTVVVLVGPLREAASVLSGSGPGRSPLTGVPFDRLLVWLCAAAATCCVAWLWTTVTLVSAQAARGRGDRALPGVPAAARRVVLAACGLALAGGLATPALATPGPVHADGTGRTASVILQGLPLPDRATGGPGGHLAPQAGHRPTRPSAADPTSYVVRPGDSLWSITRARLPGADPSDVATGVARLHHLNLAVVGADPDLIRPGQRLALPPTREDPS